MTDNQFLYFVAALLYLFECLVWVRTGGLIIQKSFSIWKITFPSNLFGNEKGGGAIGWPLPFLGRSFLGHRLPISFGESGIINATAENFGARTFSVKVTPRFVSYADIASVKNSACDLIVNGELFCRCGSPRQATFLAGFLGSLKGQHKTDKQILNFLKVSFDLDELRSSYEIFKKKTSKLRVACNLQFAFLFLVTPVLVYLFGGMLLIISLICVVAINVVIVGLFFNAHKTLYPENSSERITDTLKLFFCPPMGIRATDQLSLHYAVNYHPVILTKFFLSDHDFAKFAKKLTLSYQYFQQPDEDMEFRNEILWHFRRMEKQVLDFISGRCGMSLSDFLIAPEPAPGIASYCPRCGTQFTVGEGTCPDCSGVPLIEYRG